MTQLHDLLLGYQRTQLLYWAASLGLADLLADGPRPVDELAALTDTHAPSLYRLLRALAGCAVFAERSDGQFELTPLAGLLRSGVANSLRATALAHRADFYPVWGELGFSVRTGRPAFDQVFGSPVWSYREQHPEANTRFNAFMADRARGLAANDWRALLQAGGFSLRSIVRTGGVFDIVEAVPGS